MFTQRTGRRGRAVQGGLATVALPSAGRNELITYISQDAQGNDVVVSGTVAVPKGPTPDGGWPVISWAHGTTGVADACAPSADAPDGPAHDYLGGVEAALDRYVADGYAVVATDYVGLGTPGGHPYMNGVSEANAVTDIVRASRQLDDSLGSDWYAMGHSQGGHAALWTAATGAKRSPDLNLRGAIAIAPGGDLSSTAQYYSTGHSRACARRWRFFRSFCWVRRQAIRASRRHRSSRPRLRRCWPKDASGASGRSATWSVKCRLIRCFPRAWTPASS